MKGDNILGISIVAGLAAVAFFLFGHFAGSREAEVRFNKEKIEYLKKYNIQKLRDLEILEIHNKNAQKNIENLKRLNDIVDKVIK